MYDMAAHSQNHDEFEDMDGSVHPLTLKEG